MNLEALTAEFRAQADDKVEPYLFDSEDVTAWLNDAEREACIRSRVLREDTNADICQIAVTIGASKHTLHASLYELSHIAFKPTGATKRELVRLVSNEWLDANVDDWRDATGTPEYAIQDDATIRLVPTPDAAGMLMLEGYRLPLKAMTGDTSKPEINAAHHIHLVQWALHKAFSIPDAETFDADRATLAERKFTDYFGRRPDADLRRTTREDVPHAVQAFWP